MKVRQLIDLINKENDLYTLEEAYDIIPSNIERVKSGLELDKYRWYSKAVDVYKCEDGYVGVSGVYDIYSETDSPMDIGVSCSASEYQEVLTVTYKKKQ